MAKWGKRFVLAGVLLVALAGLAWLVWEASAPKPDHANRPYADRSDRQTLDVYLASPVTPANRAGAAPVILWIHGGGFAMGDKSRPPALDALRSAGFAVASMNYRYSSEAIWPAQRDDVAAAIRHLRAHAARYGIDPQRIGVWGASAGGALAAVAGSALAADPDTRVQAVVDWFGPVDFLTMDADMAASGVATSNTAGADSPESRLIGAPVGTAPALARAASAVALVAAMPDGVAPPPFLIMHGGRDPLIAAGQSRRLADAVRAKGGDVELVILPEGTHGGGAFDEPAAEQRVVRFFTSRLMPQR